ncbi:glycosyltransferase family 4 protein [Calditerrivibrio sp.]|uniref:glycosyltransferase family 4 protein n=1 Tax=Calditerrivibrio sp. TaxID=2792612 RepID=UPI003D0CFCD6
MKVAFVLHSHKLGGAEKHLLILIELLKNENHEVVFLGPKDSWLSDQLSIIGVEQHHIPMHGFYDIFSLAKIIKVLKRFKPELIHGHLTRGAFYAGLASKYLKIPSVATAHSTNTWKHFQYVDRIICVSNAVKNFLLHKGYDENKLRVIYNGVIEPIVAIEDRLRLRKELCVDKDEVLFGMISRIIHEKGHDIALEAFDEIGRRGKLIFVGDFNTEFGQVVKNKINKMGLSENVLLVGQQDNVYPYLSMLDIFLSPSRREAMPLAILEALGAGLPVIGSNIGGIPEAVEHGVNGFIFPSENAKEMAKYMNKLCDDLDLRKQMGINAKKSFNDRFSADIMYKSILKLYHELKN